MTETLPEIAFTINTFFILLCGALVMFMAAGFAMLEAGTVRSKSVAAILVKNIGIFSVAGVMFYLVGYNLMYRDVDGGFFGHAGLWHPDDSAALAGDFSAGYASTAGWFFQMVFVATAASVISGAVAERMKMLPFFLFCMVLTAFIYPVTGSWFWGGGWLSEMGFVDFAGSTIVHSVGGWAALTGILMLGARRARFAKDGKAQVLPGSSLPLATLGTIILWFGWFGFNGGSQLAIYGLENTLAVAKIFANTNMAAAAGVCTILGLSFITRTRIDVPMVLNGALAGLVAITAEPLAPSITTAMLVGALGALVMMGVTKLLENSRLDDVVGAVPVHLGAGIFGTLAVPLSNPDAQFHVQLIGVLAIGLFVAACSLGLWSALRAVTGLRLNGRHEVLGSDLSELGIQAYNLTPDRRALPARAPAASLAPQAAE